MKRVWAVIVITFLEGIRNRSLFGIFLVALFVLGLNIAVAGFFMREIGKVSVDMNLSALSFSGLLMVFFIGLNLIAKDIDKKTIHLVLSKPISRGQYLCGKFLGIQAFVGGSLLILVGFSSLTLGLLKGLYPDYFGDFSWATFFLAVVFIQIKLMVLGAIVVFFSTITTSSFITLVFGLCAYVVGETIEEVVFFIQSGVAADTISPLLKRTVDTITYLFPNLAAFNFQMEAAHGLAVDGERLVFSLVYGFLYILVILTCATLIFRRREFN